MTRNWYDKLFRQATTGNELDDLLFVGIFARARHCRLRLLQFLFSNVRMQARSHNIYPYIHISIQLVYERSRIGNERERLVGEISKGFLFETHEIVQLVFHSVVHHAQHFITTAFSNVSDLP